MYACLYLLVLVLIVKNKPLSPVTTKRVLSLTHGHINGYLAVSLSPVGRTAKFPSDSPVRAEHRSSRVGTSPLPPTSSQRGVASRSFRAARTLLRIPSFGGGSVVAVSDSRLSDPRPMGEVQLRRRVLFGNATVTGEKKSFFRAAFR